MVHRVLVTGSAGFVGRHLCRDLREQGHWVRGLDVKPMPDWVGVDEMRVVSLADSDAVLAAAVGVDTIAHLGATPSEADFMTKLLPNNIVGVYNIYEAARQCGVRRVIFTSTVQAVQRPGLTGGRVTLAHGVLPPNHYALTKLYGERMGEMYARMHGLSVLAVRLCWVPHAGRERPQIPDIGDELCLVYLSPRDAGRGFACAVTSAKPAPGEFGVVFFTGLQPADRGVDPAPARELIGFEAQDEWPQGMPSDL